MFSAYLIVAVMTAVANGYAASNDFIRPNWLLANMRKLSVRESWLTELGVLKAAGALGVLLGIRVPVIGAAAAAGLVLFFLGAIITHLYARDYHSLGLPIGFLLLALASLVLELYSRGPAALALAAG